MAFGCVNATRRAKFVNAATEGPGERVRGEKREEKCHYFPFLFPLFAANLTLIKTQGVHDRVICLFDVRELVLIYSLCEFSAYCLRGLQYVNVKGAAHRDSFNISVRAC